MKINVKFEMKIEPFYAGTFLVCHPSYFFYLAHSQSFYILFLYIFSFGFHFFCFHFSVFCSFCFRSFNILSFYFFCFYLPAFVHFLSLCFCFWICCLCLHFHSFFLKNVSPHDGKFSGLLFRLCPLLCLRNM